MSERGTFVTSFMYDWPNLVPVLKRLLPLICRPGTFITFEDRFFAGLMHGTYQSEESWEMEQFLLDEVVPALPAEHGEFSVVVCPESEDWTTVFTVKNGVVLRRKVGEPLVC